MMLFKDERGTLYGGISGFYGDASSDVRAASGTGDIDTAFYGVNLSTSWVQDQGFYIDGQLQFTRNSSDIEIDGNKRTIQDKLDSSSLAASVEFGMPMEFSANLTVTPQIQLAHSKLDIDGFSDGFGNAFSFAEASSRTRIGVSAERGFATNTGTGSVFGIVNLHKELDPDTRVSFGGRNFDHEIDANSVELGLGGSYLWSKHYQVWGSLNYATGLDSSGGNTALAARLNLQIRF